MAITDRVIPYTVSSLPLNIDRTNFALGMVKKANTLTVLTSHGDGSGAIKLNSTLNPAIPLDKGLQVNINAIEEIYLTNISSAGLVKIFTSYVY